MIISATIFLIIDELKYSPLKEKEFKILFSNYNGNIKKKCSVDFIGWSPEGAIFDLYMYKTEKEFINIMYPNFNNAWKDVSISDEVTFSKWKKCPMDSLALSRYKILLAIKDFNDGGCGFSFKKDLNNLKNYYSYIYINESEQYFFLYCSDKEQMYYIRRRGF